MLKLCVVLASLGIATSALAGGAFAGGTGPGDDPVAGWFYCMQESIKAEVWASKTITPQAAVAASYRSCRSDFKVALGSLNGAKAKNDFRKSAEKEQAEHVGFARKMQKMGKPE